MLDLSKHPEDIAKEMVKYYFDNIPWDYSFEDLSGKSTELAIDKCEAMLSVCAAEFEKTYQYHGNLETEYETNPIFTTLSEVLDILKGMSNIN